MEELRLTTASMEETHALGEKIGQKVRPNMVFLLEGDLGAGKTTLTQGIGEGLDVDGPVISPTFVISRVHHAHGAGPDLVHVDAYRLGEAAELADIDLDASLADSVTLGAWGAGLAEWLADDRLAVESVRGLEADDRTVYITGIGPRWAGALESLRENA